MEPIFLLIRLPVFLVGLVFVVLVATPAMTVLGALVVLGYTIKFFLGYIASVFRAAFANDPRVPQQYFDYEVRPFYRDMMEGALDMLKTYPNLFKWLLYGSPKK